jgi:hypothetical protein
MMGAPSEENPATLRLPLLRVGLKSELLDLDNELRFSPGPSDYDSYGWPTSVALDSSGDSMRV